MESDPQDVFQAHLKMTLKRAAGWMGARDRDYFEKLSGDVEYVGEVDREGKSRFLHSLDILSVPTTYREPDPESPVVITEKPKKAPLPGAKYGSFAAACHYADGTFVPAADEADCAKRKLTCLVEAQRNTASALDRGIVMSIMRNLDTQHGSHAADALQRLGGRQQGPPRPRTSADAGLPACRHRPRDDRSLRRNLRFSQ